MAGVGDLTGEASADVLLQNAATGAAALAEVSHGQISRTPAVATPGAGWTATLA